MRRSFRYICLLLLALGLATCQSNPSLLPRATPSPEPESGDSNGPSLVVLPTQAATPTLVPAVATRHATPATATPSPTPIPSASERLSQVSQTLQIEDYDRAVNELTALLAEQTALEPQEVQQARFQLGVAHLGDEAYAEAAAVLESYLAAAAESDGLLPFDPAASFHLARAYAGQGNCAQAVPAYERYLEAEPETAAYVAPLLAECHQALGNVAAARAALETAAAAPAHTSTQVSLHSRLAELYLAETDYQKAVTHYDAIHDLAQTEATKGQALYQAGQALLAAGDLTGAHERYLHAVNSYPGSYSSYLALVALIEAGVSVDDWQRGLIDHNAGAHLPAIEAFQGYIDASGPDYRLDVHLLLAGSYEALGDLPSALAQIDAYQAAAPDDPAIRATAMIRRAEMLARAGRRDEAIAGYDNFVAAFAEHPDAPQMAYRAAWLAATGGDLAQAANRYEALAEQYPGADEAPEALYRAGLARWQLNSENRALTTDYRLPATDPATTAWEKLAEDYPAHDFAAAGLVWLLKFGPEAAQEGYRQQALSHGGSSYYAYRAQDLAAGQGPFTPPPAVELALDNTAQGEAEAWLRGWLDLAPEAEVSVLDPALASDPRLALGQKLWALGLRNEAKLELESLRQSVGDNPLHCYQLALAFRDLGLYRPSIGAAATLLAASPDNMRSAPPFITHLLYPVYYAPTILSLAETYGYDPLLQFALVRQESLFESFAISSAAAKGLSQVIPATGADIAAQLQWPNYSDEDLYRPIVGLSFGAYYLDQQLDAFDGDVYAALAAYNGGPGNAARWKSQAPDDPDLFLEVVDYAETKQYIQRIYVGYAIYRGLYGTASRE